MSFLQILAIVVALYAAIGLWTYRLTLAGCREDGHLPDHECRRRAAYLGALGPIGLLVILLLTLDDDTDAPRQ